VSVAVRRRPPIPPTAARVAVGLAGRGARLRGYSQENTEGRVEEDRKDEAEGMGRPEGLEGLVDGAASPSLSSSSSSSLASWDEFASATQSETFRLSHLLVLVLSAFNAASPKAPWKLDTVALVMITWIVSFWIAAYKVVPSMLSFLKTAVLAPQNVALSYSGEAAVRHLLLDASQMVVIAVLLQRALRAYAYREFFAMRSKSTSRMSWIAVGFGVALFPAVDWLHRTMVTLFSGGGQFHNAAPSASASVGMFDGDGVYIKLLWFLVLGLAAPIWEEVMFRGFLLPSLARATSPAVGVVMTSLLFSLVHFTREGFLPLMVLGTIFGISYCVTRGLFAPILLHGG